MQCIVSLLILSVVQVSYMTRDRIGQCSFPTCNTVYHFINLSKTWNEAQKYCREKYSDLATVDNMDVNRVIGSATSYKGTAWIGLEKRGERQWYWTLPGLRYNEKMVHWNDNEPNDYMGSIENCAEMRKNGKWNDIPCDRTVPFVCYNGSENSTIQFHLIKQSKTWRKAQRFCREKYTDLASVRNKHDNSAIRSITGSMASDFTAIGLFRDSWKWSDGSVASFRNWYLQMSDSDNNKMCGVILLSNGDWSNEKCHEQLPFFCYNEPGVIKTLAVARVTETSVLLSWSRPAGNWDFYSVEVRGQLTRVTSIVEQAEVPGLTPGGLYTFDIVPELNNGSIRGVPAAITAYTKPSTVSNLTVSDNTHHSLLLSWEPPKGNCTGYRVQALNATDNTHKNLPQCISIDKVEDDPNSILFEKEVIQTSRSVRVTSLTACSRLLLSVVTLANDSLEGDSVTVRGFTLPVPPTDARILFSNHSHVTLEWTPPANMFYVKYKVSYNAGFWDHRGSRELENITKLTFGGFHAGTKYDFKVQTLAEGLESLTAVASQCTEARKRDITLSMLCSSKESLLCADSAIKKHALIKLNDYFKKQLKEDVFWELKLKKE